MIARLFLLLPFNLTVPDGQSFTVYGYDDDGYRVLFYPPGRSDRTPSSDAPEEIRIDGTPAFQADSLRIDFLKDSFERKMGAPVDPSHEIMGRAVNSFLLRLRHVARAPQIRPISFPSGTWRLQYLNDDGSELEKQEGFVRGHGTLSYSFSWIALNSKIWDDIHGLPPEYIAPAWESLLLDAGNELPSIGPAIVLAATALEVFITTILDRLADVKKAPPELWKWINNRGDWLREPTVEEQFDGLLRYFTGHSLKEDQRLWELFKNLKTARNSFVHEGTSRIGGTAISTDSAQKLIIAAAEIINKIKGWLPAELLWPDFKHEIKVESFKRLR